MLTLQIPEDWNFTLDTTNHIKRYTRTRRIFRVTWISWQHTIGLPGEGISSAVVISWQRATVTLQSRFTKIAPKMKCLRTTSPSCDDILPQHLVQWLAVVDLLNIVGYTNSPYAILYCKCSIPVSPGLSQSGLHGTVLTDNLSPRLFVCNTKNCRDVFRLQKLIKVI